jgi:transposase, IS5 family
LAKRTRRLGEDVVVQLNRALLARAAEHKVLGCHTLRADTTVVGANLASPTDLGLLARAVDRRQSTLKRVQQAGGATRTRVRDRRRSARRRAHQVAQALRSRTDQAKQVVAEVLGELAAWPSCQPPRPPGVRPPPAAPGAGWRRLGSAQPRPGRVGDHIAPSTQVILQARARLAGDLPDGATRLVSLHDPDARPIRKGAWADWWSSATRPKWSIT